MSTKRIISTTLLGILFVIVVIGALLLASYLERDNEVIILPDTSEMPERPVQNVPDTLQRVEVTRETIQAVVSTLQRPEIYSREVVIESFWEDGQAVSVIDVSVHGGVTSLRTQTPAGVEKSIIVTPDTLYIWYRGDSTPFVGSIDSTGDGIRTADEWQMLLTYEDILHLEQNEIIDAGYTEFEGEDCVHAVYRSPLLGYTRTYYISLTLGLVVAAREYDGIGELIYAMTAGESAIGEVDASAFMLPDGTSLIGN